MSALCHRTELQPAVAVRESDVLAPAVSSCIWFIVTFLKKNHLGVQVEEMRLAVSQPSLQQNEARLN